MSAWLCEWPSWDCEMLRARAGRRDVSLAAEWMDERESGCLGARRSSTGLKRPGSEGRKVCEGNTWGDPAGFEEVVLEAWVSEKLEASDAAVTMTG